MVFFLSPDAFYAVVQPSGKVATSEMVCRASGQGEEEDYPGADHHNLGEKAQNVFVLGVEGL